MTDLSFPSLRHEISHHVHAAREPLTKPQLMPMCKLAADDKALSNALYQMCQVGQLTRHPAPAGSGARVSAAYGPGRVEPGAEDDEPSAGGATARRRVKRPKTATTKRIKRVRKVQRRAAKRARNSIEKVSLATRRWALTNDGAFLLLGTPIEIPKPAARALVDFVRTLDAAEA